MRYFLAGAVVFAVGAVFGAAITSNAFDTLLNADDLEDPKVKK